MLLPTAPLYFPCLTVLTNAYEYKPFFVVVVVLGLHCCMPGFSSCGEAGQLSSCSAWAFALWWLLFFWSTSSTDNGLQYSWFMGLVAPWHVESSQTRDQTHVSCIGKQIPNHWTTRKILFLYFFKYLLIWLH